MTTLAAALTPVVLLGGEESGLTDEQRQRLQDPAERDALSRAVPEAVLELAARTRG